MVVETQSHKDLLYQMSNEEIIIDALKRIEGKLDKLNGRTRSLENWRAGIVSVLAFVAFWVIAGTKIIELWANG